MNTRPLSRRFLLLSLLPVLGACMVGPDYHRPAAIMAARLKEMPPPPGWAYADPHFAELPKGAWWTLYNDPVLNRLESRVKISNQTIKADAAAYDEARALVDEARAQLFPTATLTPSVTRTGSGAGSAAGIGSASGRATSYQLSGSVDWQLDVWGAVRRQVESQVAAAQVAQATLDAALLSEQTTLATDYFELRYQDSLQTLLNQFIAYYQSSVDITRNEYNAGIVASTDLLEAQTQVATTRAQAVQVGILRAQYEHAIAVLTGVAPGDFAIEPGSLTGTIPAIPVTVPSLLLQRRPDIAESERMMEEENAQIGVAVAAYFPTISLSAIGSYAGNPIGALFNAANQSWSIAATAAETLFEGGLRSATVRAAQASFDEAVATYRQTVLSAFEQLEDELSSLRILAAQADAQAKAVDLSNQTVIVALNQYRAGTTIYTTVLTDQTTALSNAETLLGIQESRVLDSVQLIDALGGGWDASELTSKNALQTDNPLLPSFISPDKN